jgi:hypothetical protein
VVAIRNIVALVLAALALAALPSGASARTHNCGYFNGTFDIRATNVSCRTAYHVIRNFACYQSPCDGAGFSGRYQCWRRAIPQYGGRWTCRRGRHIVSFDTINATHARA